MSTRHRPFEDRWNPVAGQGTLGASYLPCCAARLASEVDWTEARARLGLLWSERAAALRFRRAVTASRATSAAAADVQLTLARLQREAFAYEAGAARIRRIELTRAAWLVRHLRSRRLDPAIGAAFSTMAADLAVLVMAIQVENADQLPPHLIAASDSA